MVADNIFGKSMKSYKGTYGTSVVRSFDLYAACVGLNEKMMLAKKLPYSCVHIHPGSHAGYYPGSKQVHFKLIFDPKDGTIFGAQAVGEDGVEKRIDVIATAIQAKLKVEDVAELELCYAPPVGSAKDVVNLAGMAAQNIVDGLVTKVEWNQLDSLAHSEEVIILDVRNPEEIKRTGKIASGALNIPLKDLREHLDDIDKDKHIVVTCASGQRAYYACRILQQHGFEQVDYLGGAYMTFHEVHPEVA
jgi:rhodanese-related sulfurtransferase